MKLMPVLVWISLLYQQALSSHLLGELLHSDWLHLQHSCDAQFCWRLKISKEVFDSCKTILVSFFLGFYCFVYIMIFKLSRMSE